MFKFDGGSINSKKNEFVRSFLQVYYYLTQTKYIYAQLGQVGVDFVRLYENGDITTEGKLCISL
jgi:hypothetical protein